MDYIGVDLHSDCFTICRRDREGTECFDEFGLSPAEIGRFVAGLSKRDWVAVEATGNAAWFCDRVRDRVERIVVVNTREFRPARRSVRKTDHEDAKTLAFHLSKNMLPSTRIKTRIQDDIATLVHSRDLLVRQQTALSNKVHGLYVRLGIRLSRNTLKIRKHLLALDLDILSPAQRHVVVQFREQILALNGLIRQTEGLIVVTAKGMEGFEGIASIKGIGELSAAILLAEIGDVGDFSSPEKLASFFGIVPRVKQSNQTVVHGRITKAGNRKARTTLIQCAWVAIRHSRHLHDHFERIARNSGSRNKAIVATGRKLLRIIYFTLKKGWVFEDFPNFKIRPPK